MPLGATLAIVGAVGGFAASKLSGGSSAASNPGGAPNTQSLVDQATKDQPPSAVQAASNATAQANIAALKQRKKAAAGDTLLTPATDTGRSGTANAPAPATLIGSR